MHISRSLVFLSLCMSSVQSAIWQGWSKGRSAGVPPGNTALDDWVEKQEAISLKVILSNINPPGTRRGFFAASLSTSDPDYFYTWTRDAAKVAGVLVHAYDTSRRTDLHDVLIDYVEFQIGTQQTTTLCQCLGEPKFNPDGTGFSGEWGRPQNDGPAVRASTFLLLSQALSQKKYVTNILRPAVYRDLDYIVDNWATPSFDLWEEVLGVHFYTLMVMRRALLQGVAFSRSYEDAIHAANYQGTIGSIEERLESFWSPSRNYILATQDRVRGYEKPSGLDIAIILAANQLSGSIGGSSSSIKDGFFTPDSDKVLATAAALEYSFGTIYPLNQDLPSHLGIAIGRYPEDVYDGHRSSQGNPWFITTSAFTELYYNIILAFKARPTDITVNHINRPFFVKFDSQAVPGKIYVKASDEYNLLLADIAASADRFLATVKYHEQANGSLSEQFNRWTGFQQGARDLTWSHAALISATRARAGRPLA
ncbi:glycoside hydrolase family 15 protein [Phycomyces blakesleeanus]|uniref:glucan 1,4-alpha-glucosidase n=2 Tax=Phycomyces blakesleeanus TaxID=4837 RepID=A0A167PSM9_PHYB8|nr:glycoside hydrolase family 15 protein [Phycomyces blakesleeanus NRRL 1555(-)]OAD78468.1 glycoside hydrolase family 15 protein [Phycomyces blakesleeanus NRRL 1555(-)]|eukprot:XP_018296508.1 glycoside hydrolase family 15 protein [Phycomyces blakesleeanus NRRL 1555(-)]